MKGYFSELARHTGVRIGGGGPTGAASPSPPSAPQNIRSEVKGLDVEEVVFTSSSPPPTAERTPTGVEHISTDAVGSVPAPGDTQGLERAHTNLDSDQQSDFSRPQFFADATFEVTTPGNPTGSKTRAEEGSVPSAEMETGIVGPPRVVISEQISTRARTPGAKQIPESVSALEERNAISEVERFDSPDRNQTRSGVPASGRSALVAEQSETGLEEQIERQTIVRNYLQEISEWISTPASPEAEPDSFISADSVASAEDQARRPARSNATLPARLRADAPEQDLSLSIGTIKIVVEEPRKEALAPPAPPAKPERTLERTTAVPTDLSRYYINRW